MQKILVIKKKSACYLIRSMKVRKNTRFGQYIFTHMPCIYVPTSSSLKKEEASLLSLQKFSFTIPYLERERKRKLRNIATQHMATPQLTFRSSSSRCSLPFPPKHLTFSLQLHFSREQTKKSNPQISGYIQIFCVFTLIQPRAVLETLARGFSI